MRFPGLCADGRLRLPVCQVCGSACYPLRENCPSCLSDSFDWRPFDGYGEVLAITTLHHSNEPYFKSMLPIRIGSIRLGPGIVAIAFLGSGVGAGDPVQIECQLDAQGKGHLLARAR